MEETCINPKCNSKRDLTSANLSVKRFYGVKRSNVGMKDGVCRNCLSEYEQVAGNEMTQMDEGVIDLSSASEDDVCISDGQDVGNKNNNNVNVNDKTNEHSVEHDGNDEAENVKNNASSRDSEESSSDDSDDILYEFDEDELDKVIADCINNSDFNVKVDSALEQLNGSINKLSSRSNWIDQAFDGLKEQTQNRRRDLDEIQGIVREELEPVEFDDILPSQIKYSSINKKQTFSPYSVAATSDMQEVIPIGNVVTGASSSLPPTGAIRRTELYVNMRVYAMKASYFGIWYKARIIEILQNSGEKQYKVKFDLKRNATQTRTLSGKHLAYIDPAEVILPVGARIIALYKDEYWNQANSMYAGIIAEPPKTMNNFRYLIFFDDGYAQYIRHNQIHLVCEVSKDVWDDIHPDSKEFIRSYLHQYPERPMVKLQKGQVVKTEWNGKWWIARVADVDGSLVKMYFDADKRTEWIYRGSTRLAPLYSELANAEANKAAGKLKRHNLLLSKKKNAPYVEYTRGLEENQRREDTQITNENSETDNVMDAEFENETEMEVDVEPEVNEMEEQREKKQVAKKHTAAASSSASSSSSSSSTSSSLSFSSPRHNVAKKSTAQAPKRDSNLNQLASRIECEGSYEIKFTQEIDSRQRFRSHNCSPACIESFSNDLSKVKGHNPLLIPMLFGWERLIVKYQTAKKLIHYRTPCGRRLRNIDEVHFYLICTDSQLSVDLFSFDYIVHCFGEFVPVKPFYNIKDISYSKENVPISCVNSLSRHYPEYVEYSTERIPAKGVYLNTDPEFLVGCDCTDDCADKSKCSCQQLTLSTLVDYQGFSGNNFGYNNRRLREQIVTGIYECNPRCKCRKQCLNRVVQNGLQLRLQVFKTARRGWGLRCLDDIPHGCFICIYAGQLLTEQGANDDGTQFGDEYLAELDYIEVVEKLKEGYESDVVDQEEDGSSSEGEKRMESMSDDGDEVPECEESGPKRNSDSGTERGDRSSDSDFEPFARGPTAPRQKSLRSRKYDRRADEKTCKKSLDFVHEIRPLSPGTLEEIGEAKLIRRPRVNETPEENNANSKNREKKLTRKHFRFKALPNPSLNVSAPDAGKENKNSRHASVRTYFGEEYCYIMDAKAIGNIGRYLNHSCSPNVFVQNVFVDTHDLRFPWVAFFAMQYIRAGTELTWDYNYDVGSVPGKVLYCYCGAAECRRRLL